MVSQRRYNSAFRGSQVAGLSVPQLEKIRQKDPVLAEILQMLIDYINRNVTPVVGDKVTK